MLPSSSSSSSSLDSCNQPPPSRSSASSCSSSTCRHECDGAAARRDLSTDLRLGLSISPSHGDFSSSSTQREQKLESWPPISKPLLSAMAGKADNWRRQNSLFVKVYMEGVPIGRKLDLFVHDGYNALISTLAQMFRATILRPGAANHCHCGKHHVLTYEDKEGDWMMVGDVPWEMFLTTVKRLKITRASVC